MLGAKQINEISQYSSKFPGLGGGDRWSLTDT